MPFTPSPLGGILGARTATIYLLDPTGTAPVEPVSDLVPGFTPFRVTFDVVDAEGRVANYDVTEHAIQRSLLPLSGGDLASHVRKRLKQVNITGTLGATIPLSPTAGFIPNGQGFQGFSPGVIPRIPANNDIFIPTQPPMPGSAFRMDLLRYSNLERIADSLLPVMIVTPRWMLSPCAITSLQESWTPQNGESVGVIMTLKEVRFVSPVPGVPDDVALAPGNTSVTNAGTTSASSTGTTATSSSTPGSAPTAIQGATAAPGAGGALQ